MSILIYDDDAYVYKNMRLKPNTTYTISVYGKKMLQLLLHGIL